MTEDSIRSGLNWYTYCSGNPLSYIDPFGLAQVAARDYAMSNGAEKVAWTGNYTYKGVTYANATVTANGKTIYITGQLIDNRLMIDDSVLNIAFGWGKLSSAAPTQSKSNSLNDSFISGANVKVGPPAAVVNASKKLPGPIKVVSTALTVAPIVWENREAFNGVESRDIRLDWRTTTPSTGRTIPNSLDEQLAMLQVKSNPLNGAIQEPLQMGDERWPASEGWVKMRNTVRTFEGKITIHFNYNTNTGAFADFKFQY